MNLALDKLRLDGGTQPREAIDPVVVSDYAESMRAGVQFPPIIVFYDGAVYWLADGFHRVKAALLAGLTDFPADVYQGAQREAILYSVGANATHGLRRSNADKRRAVLALLNDPEWSQLSDREIARRCNVSQPFVSGLRSDNVITLTACEARIREGLATIEASHSEMGETLRSIRQTLTPDQWAAYLALNHLDAATAAYFMNESFSRDRTLDIMCRLIPELGVN
jgi:hypothetical protein